VTVTLVFFLYLLGATLAGAGLCALTTALWPDLGGLAPHRVVNRLGLLLALAGLWWFLRAQGLGRAAALGLDLRDGAFWRRFGLGYLAGLAILGGLLGLLLALDLRHPTPWDAPWPKVLAQGLFGGLAVAAIEEVFFRGALMSAILRRGGGPLAAALWSSGLFALLHFLKPQPAGGCLTSVGAAFIGLLRNTPWDAFAALFVVGLFLAWTRLRSGHLAWALGLHAAWVLVIRIAHSTSDLTPGAPLGFLVSPYDGITGWLAAGWLLLLMGLAGMRRRPRPP